MPTLHLLFSHSLTPDQVEDAYHSLGVRRLISLPTDLQGLFSNVPPELASLADYLKPIESWLAESTMKGDYVLVQGDFGVVYLLVNFCKQIGTVPIYATTERKSIDTTQPDGSVVTQRIFKHKIFREYMR